jgi:predicted choloylglycine hydrolase
MSCPQIDWVQDSLLNPGFLTMHPSPGMFIKDVGQDYSIYNSYPRFSSDWRWYKSLYEEKKKFNKVFIDNFLKNIHNFLDYRFVFDQRSSMLNAELEQLCFEFKNVVTMFEDQKNNNSISQAVVIIDKVKQNIASLKSPLEKSIDEVLNVIKTNKIDTETISQMKYFKKCFGRELFYVSVLRDN